MHKLLEIRTPRGPTPKDLCLTHNARPYTAIPDDKVPNRETSFAHGPYHAWDQVRFQLYEAGYDQERCEPGTDDAGGVCPDAAIRVGRPYLCSLWSSGSDHDAMEIPRLYVEKVSISVVIELFPGSFSVCQP